MIVYVYDGVNLVAERTIWYHRDQTEIKREDRRYVWLGMRPVGMSRSVDDGASWTYYDIASDRLGRPTAVFESERRQKESDVCDMSDLAHATDCCISVEFDPSEYEAGGNCAACESGGECPGYCEPNCEPVIVFNHWVRWSTSYTPYGLTYNECKAAIDYPTGDLEDDDPSLVGKCAFDFNLRAPGQYFDAETGFYYNGQRYYVPPMRRYNRPEPIGQAGSLDLYMYAGGNPVNRIDPTGLDDVPDS